MAYRADASILSSTNVRRFCRDAADPQGDLDKLKAAEESARQQATFANQIIQADANLTSARRKRARPIKTTSDVLLYQSSVDIQYVADTAQQNCLLGSGLAVVGFGAFIASVAPSVPPFVFVALLSGAMANCYALSAIALRVLRNLAARHVEQLVIVHTPASEQPITEEGASTELFMAATAEENLEVTPEVRLEIRTGSASNWVTLVDLKEADLEDSSRRASFGDLCCRLRLLHIDTDNPGICPDIALLTALTSSSKVVAEDRREARTDEKVARVLRVPEGLPPPGPMLSDLTVADVEDGQGSVSIAPPADTIDQMGRRARNGGVAILLTGGLFALGESARDADGVARWTNLRLPI